MKDRNKYNKFMKEIINPAKFILNTLELSRKDIKKLSVLNATTEALDDIFENIISREGVDKLSETFKISKTSWSNISDNLSSKKLLEIKLSTMMNLGNKYEKIINNNIDKIDCTESIRVLYATKGKINDIYAELKGINVCSDASVRKYIVDMIKNLSVVILKSANEKGLIEIKNMTDNIDFNNRHRDVLQDIVHESNKLNINETNVNINLSEDWEGKFNGALSTYKAFSNKLISSMNDVDISLLDDYDVTDMEFKRKSFLFRENNTVPITSNTFRARFSSLMLSYISKRMSKMALVISNEYDERLMSGLSTMINISIKYNTDVLKNKRVNHYDMIKCLMGSKGNNKSMNNNIQTLNKLDEFVNGIDNNLTGKNTKLEKELQMNYIVRIAYMLTTINDNLNIDYPDDFSFRRKDDTKKVVERLGKAINKANNREGKRNKVFDLFNNAKSKLFVKYNQQELDDDLLTGCRALSFASFVFNNKRVDSVVKALIY